MRLKPKLLAFALAAPMLLLLPGCGGISASRSVSPATFLVPGLLKADPPQTVPSPEQDTPVSPLPAQPGGLLAQY